MPSLQMQCLTPEPGFGWRWVGTPQGRLPSQAMLSFQFHCRLVYPCWDNCTFQLPHVECVLGRTLKAELCYIYLSKSQSCLPRFCAYRLARNWCFFLHCPCNGREALGLTISSCFSLPGCEELLKDVLSPENSEPQHYQPQYVDYYYQVREALFLSHVSVLRKPLEWCVVGSLQMLLFYLAYWLFLPRFMAVSKPSILFNCI